MDINTDSDWSRALDTDIALNSSSDPDVTKTSGVHEPTQINMAPSDSKATYINMASGCGT